MRKLPHVGYRARDRGPLEFRSRLRREEGNVMFIARRQVVTIPPTMRIKEVAELMVNRGARRLPVVDPGTKRLRGIVRTRDLVDFLGGGKRFGIIQRRFRGNFFAAVNSPIRLIMSERVVHGTTTMSIAEVAELLHHTGFGGVPLVDERGRVAGMVSERDFLAYMPPLAGIQVNECMTRRVIMASPELPIKRAAKLMISRGVRRLPVVEQRKLVGIVTSVDILRYFGTSEMFEHMASGEVEEALKLGVSKIMTREVLTTSPGMDVGQAARLMVERGCGGLPVVEGGNLVGIITERDMLELMV